MVTVGVDAHKHSHTVVAVDDLGRVLGQKTVAATPPGHLEALRFAEHFGDHEWAIEDCRHLTRRLEVDLLRAGQTVRRVPPRLMGIARGAGRERGKSDPIDALAVARAALREELPAARLDGPDREVRLLLDHREDLVNERTRAQNRLRWHLHELLPGFDPPAGSLDRTKVLDDVVTRLGVCEGMVADLARELVGRIRADTTRINELEREITQRVKQRAAALLALPGCGALSAAKIIGEAAGVRRFKDRSAFARHNGTAPIPVWSGNTTRHRLNRGGNRQLNAAIHRIAITQMRVHAPAQAYMTKRQAIGDTKTEALRALRRRISDEVFKRLIECEAARTPLVQDQRPAAA